MASKFDPLPEENIATLNLSDITRTMIRRLPTFPKLRVSVSSASEDLTAGFGMEPGVPPPVWPPKG